MISACTIQALEQWQLHYILGAWLQRQREVWRQVLGRAGRYQEVAENLRVKEVWVEGRRYIVCHNSEEAAKDVTPREAILRALADQPRQRAKPLVGNRGFRRFLWITKGAVTIDAAEVAVQYKRLLLVEPCFRAAKSLLETRPIFHQWDTTIAGHVFCSFLALVLVDEL